MGRINKNEIYVTKRPIKSIMSVIIMDTKFPISSNSHEYIEALQKISDTCYLFSDKFYESKGINKRKFTTLYEGNLFIDCTGDSIIPLINKTFDYSIEIFNRHASFLVFNLSDLETFQEEDFKKLLSNIQKVNVSNIKWPILNIKRLSSEEMYEYYKEFPTIDEGSYLNTDSCFSLTGIISKLNLEYFNYLILKENSNNTKNTYASWKTTSRIQFFKRIVISEFLKFLEENPNFIETFSGDRIDQVYASIIKRLNLKNQNINIEDLNLEEI